ncbi:RNA-binding domain-containing protein [Mycoplasma mycoides]|uniref:RNA-binding domain-containing protein n=1 Tax=Mycoplasma mycoides TaxID=2102 RepID=UPI00223FC850|nr:RNA-binding domain-containing protein [Mycoplasma mycoides]QVJ96044.1 putative DNA binding domain-containing protein [Mycoplasma mycoides subsp. capri]
MGFNYSGETTTVEYKVTFDSKNPDNFLHTVSAFANTKGGKIFVGINDNNQIVGLEDPQTILENISEAIKTKIDPNPEFYCEIEEHNGLKFIIVSILKGEQTPYRYLTKKADAAYIRSGNQSIKASTNQLRNLMFRGTKESFDTLKTKIHWKEANFKSLNLELKKIGQQANTVHQLTSLGLVKDEFLTYAGALIADNEFIKSSKIHNTRWNGNDKTNSDIVSLKTKEYKGSLIDIFLKTEQFIDDYNSIMWKKTDTKRIDYVDYPFLAVREALVNALIHRDYSIDGSQIDVDIYDNRIEIISPGGMFDGTNIQEVPTWAVVSRRRNEAIADIFWRINYMEKRGSGLGKIIELYASQHNYTNDLKPIFMSNEHLFKVILWNLNYKKDNLFKSDKRNLFENKMDIKVADLTDKIDKSQDEIVLDYIKSVSSFTRKDIEKVANVKRTRANQIINNLLEEHKIVRVNGGRSTKYKVNR